MRRPSRRFVPAAKRLTAYDLARNGEAAVWNEWRQEANLFGDHQRNRINLSAVDLAHANLGNFNLTNVSFHRANLMSADLTGTDCAYSDFHECKLICARIQRANLRFARLSRAYLRDANLDFSDLRGCDLRRASLTGASMIGADVRGVDLSSSRGLGQAQLDDAVGDGHTRIPSHLERPAAWEMYERDRDRDDEGIENLRIIPASIEVAVVGGMIELSREPGDAYFAATTDPNVIRAEILSDLTEVNGRCGNIPELARAIRLYHEELNKEAFDVILVGTRGLRLERVFQAVMDPANEEGPGLLPDAAGLMRAILVQHFLFVGQSHRWKAFLEEAELAPYTNEAAAVARSSGQQIASVLETHQAACQPSVPRAVTAVTDEVEISDDNQRLAVFNVFASIENVFKSVVTWILKESRRLLGDSYEAFRSGVAKAVGGGLALLASSLLLSPVADGLASKYPQRFGWLHHATEMIKDAEGFAKPEPNGPLRDHKRTNPRPSSARR